MKRRIFLLLCYSLLSSSLLGQSTQSSLWEVHKNKICIKGTKTPYTGIVEGLLYYRDMHSVHEVMLQVKGYILNANYHYLDSFPKTPYIKGYVVNGKAEGRWKFYDYKDSILIAESSFIHGKINGELIIYDVYNIMNIRGFIAYYRKGKYLYSQELD